MSINKLIKVEDIVDGIVGCFQEGTSYNRGLIRTKVVEIIETTKQSMLDSLPEEKEIWQKEQAEQLKSLLNKSKTERGLGIALANYIKNIKE